MTTKTIEIKHRFDSNRVLYVAENVADVRAAVVGAAKANADLRDADLRGADLGGADLRGADLRGADLRGADLGGADLRGADLGGADLRGAYLGGAYLGGADLGGAYLGGAYLGGADLRGADDPRSPLHAIRQDVWAVLDEAPAEVAGLRAAIVAGKVNGSTYEGPCACLVGTIAKVRDVKIDELNLRQDASRPAEQWYMPIREGDLPLDERPADGWPSEGVYRASLALQWTDEWVTSRTAIAAALAS